MSVIVFAQTEERKLDISGQIRMRGENDAKDFNNDTDPSDFTLLRSRLNLKFSYSEKLIAFAQLQDSRTFGEEGTDGATATLASLKNVDLHEGYIQLNHLFFPWLSYKFGRMAIKYDTQRLIGINEWSNIGRSFDGSIVTLSFQKIRIDMLNVTLYESGRAPDLTDGDQTLTGVWVKINSSKLKNFNIYALTDEDRQIDADDNFKIQRATVGAQLKKDWSPVHLEAELNLQTGKMDYKADILAYYLSGALGFDLGKNKKTSLSLGIDYLSGDKTNTNKYECFNTLYPAKHGFFGYMDYFTDIPKHTRNLGLTDLMAKLKTESIDKIKLAADVHYFRLSQSAVLEDASSSKELGAEIDLTFGYDYSNNVNFTFGTSFFMPGKVFKEWKGADPSFWFYGQTSVSF
jgi:hypothetical protein